MIRYSAPTRSLQPVLDLSPWLDGSDRAKVARQLDQICRDVGFFYLVGHGVPQARFDQMLALARRFFALDLSTKLKYRLGQERRGYDPFAQQSLDADSPPDLKEALLIGEGNPPDHPLVLEGRPDYGPNRWPDDTVLPGFRAPCLAFFHQTLALSKVLMDVFAMIAGLPPGWFEPMMVDPMATMRLLHYPPQPPLTRDNQIGAGAHTDWGAFTLLVQDDIGGLEVQHANGEWLYADPMPGAYVVNVGDMIPVWTNGAYHSNSHRVLNRRPDADRYSIPFFLDPHYYARIECLDAFRTPGEEPRHAPRTAGEHIELMYQITYGQAVS